MIFSSFVSKKDLLNQIAINTAVKENPAAVIANATAKASATKTVAILTLKQQEELINSNLLKKEQLEQITTELGLQTAKNGTLLATEVLNVAKLKEIMTSQGVQKETQEEILQKIALSSANKKAAASTGLLNRALNAIKAHPIVALITAISTLAIGIATVKNELNKAKEEARQSAIELTNAYNQEKSSLDSQIEKYKELKETLDKGNLSTNEARSIKEQLLGIQQSLIDSYDDEASNIDLVNGKYKEQLGLLSELSKEKATEYVTKTKDKFSDAKKALSKERTYNLGTVANWSSYIPKTNEQQSLLDFIKSYSKLLDLKEKETARNQGEKNYSAVLSVKANVEDADEIMKQFYVDLEKYGKENNIDVSGLLENISKQRNNTWTDELKDYKTIYDEFMKAEIVRNDTLRPLYQESIKAVEDYNNALSTGEGVEEAKSNLDSLKQSVQNATGELEGSQDVFDDIYDSINKDAEAAYNLGQSFENDKVVKLYAEILRGLSDIDLKAINFENDIEQPGKKAFISLMKHLGYTEDKAQDLIDKLVELGYIQGKLQESMSPDTTEPLSISSSIEQLSKQLEPQYSKLGDAYSKIFTENGFTRDNIDNSMLEGLRATFSDIEKELGVTFDTSLLNTFFDSLTDGTQSAEEVQQAFNDLATSYIYSTDVLESLNEETADSVMLQLKQLGVKNAEEVVTAQLTANERKLSAEKELLNKTGKDFTNITYGEVNSLKAQNAVTEESVKNITLLAIQKQAASLSTISTSDDIENLHGLIYALAATGVACTKLKTLIDLLNSEEVMPEERKNNIVNSIQEEINAIMKGEGVEIQIDFDGGSASEKAKGTAKDITDMLEKELAVLDRAMEAGYLDFNDYINRRLGLIEDYYNKGKISADQYYSYLQKHYETELSYMDKVTNAVTRRLDKEKQSLEKQKESINERYQKEIDALEKRKSILQEEADNLQRQRDLEKALYDLRRAEEQRTQKIYTADKGFNYVADPNAIRDAQDDVATKKLQIEIAEIDKAIKKLEEARDKEVEAIDQRIEKIEEYKEKWQQISEEFTQKQEDMIAAMVLGADWENDILNQRLDTLENFKDRYIALQQAIVDAAYQAAKAEKDASGATISDTSAGKGGGTPKKEETPNDPTKDDTSKSEQKYVVLYKNPNSGQVSTISKFDKMEDAENKATELNRNNLEDIYIVRNPKDNSEKIFTNKQDAQKYAELSGLKMYPSKRRKPDSYYVQKYHTGLDQGYVSKYRPISEDEKLKMFQKFSRSDLRPDEVPALLKAGELVMTQNQQDNILKNLQMTYALNSVPANNNQVVNHVTINCPNVTNNSGAEYLMKELNRLTLDALQYANKRY